MNKKVKISFFESNIVFKVLLCNELKYITITYFQKYKNTRQGQKTSDNIKY